MTTYHVPSDTANHWSLSKLLLSLWSGHPSTLGSSTGGVNVFIVTTYNSPTQRTFHNFQFWMEVKSGFLLHVSLQSQGS